MYVPCTYVLYVQIFKYKIGLITFDQNKNYDVTYHPRYV